MCFIIPGTGSPSSELSHHLVAFIWGIGMALAWHGIGKAEKIGTGLLAGGEGKRKRLLLT
jgi:hypothetical protein